MHATENGRKCEEIYSQLEIVPLGLLLKVAEKEQASLDSLRGALLRFQCPKNSDEENFIHAKAIPFEQRNKARTFLIVCKNKIVAYFSLAIKSLDLQNLSKSKIKELTAGENVETYSAYLIGHIAKCDDFKIPILDYIMDITLDLIELAQKIVGGRLLYLDCKNEPKLTRLYESYGFKYFNTSEKTGLLQYYFKI